MKDGLVHPVSLPHYFPQYLQSVSSDQRMVVPQSQFSTMAHPNMGLFEPCPQQQFPHYFNYAHQTPQFQPMMADPRSYLSPIYSPNIMLRDTQRLSMPLMNGQSTEVAGQQQKDFKAKTSEKSTQTNLPIHNHLCSCRSETKDRQETMALTNKVIETDNCSLSQGPSDECVVDDAKGDLPNFSENDWTQPHNKPIGNSSVRFDLTNLSTVIQGLFIEGTVSQQKYETLSLFEKRLLYYLVKRKFAPKALKDLEPDENTCNYDKLKRIFSTQLPRRPEECYKFVLTRVLKHLRRKFEEEDPTQNPEVKVNDVYFRPVSEKFGIPMSDFNYPLAGDQKGKFHFNFVYFTKIFKSEPFLRKINEYSKEAIFVDFQKDLVKKVVALIHKWERNLSNDMAFLEYAQMSILRYVIFNKRCKLPWTRVDVQNAIERVKDLIQICSEGKSNIGGHLIRNANKMRENH